MHTCLASGYTVTQQHVTNPAQLFVDNLWAVHYTLLSKWSSLLLRVLTELVGWWRTCIVCPKRSSDQWRVAQGSVTRHAISKSVPEASSSFDWNMWNDEQHIIIRHYLGYLSRITLKCKVAQVCHDCVIERVWHFLIRLGGNDVTAHVITPDKVIPNETSPNIYNLSTIM